MFRSSARSGRFAVFAAIVEASVFDGAGTVAKIVARPATLVVVVGVVAESPGLAPLAILSDVDVLPGAAECFVAAPGVVMVAVFAAVVEASATCGVKSRCQCCGVTCHSCGGHEGRHRTARILSFGQTFRYRS